MLGVWEGVDRFFAGRWDSRRCEEKVGDRFARETKKGVRPHMGFSVRLPLSGVNDSY